MFSTKIKTLIVAGAVALGTLAASANVANAGSRGGVYIDGPGFSVGFGDRGHRWHRGDRWDRGDRWERPRYKRFKRCKPHKALRKAKRRGLRRAYIARVNHRGVVIKGRKWGERVVIGFGRHRSCPVRFVRAR